MNGARAREDRRDGVVEDIEMVVAVEDMEVEVVVAVMIVMDKV